MTSTFEKSVKPRAVEELVDYYFYRRLANLLVPLFYKLNFTPNQVTTLSLITGLSAAFLVLNQKFILGALVAILAIIFDCCDGQLARLKNMSHPLGRILDGLFDAIWVTVLWFFVYFSGIFDQESPQFKSIIFCSMIAGGVSTFVHCYRYDAAKVKFSELVLPHFSEKDLDYNQAVELMKSEWKKKNLFSAFLSAFMVFHVYFFTRGKEEKKDFYHITAQQQQKIEQHLSPLIRYWSWLGEGFHNTVVIIGLFLATIHPYFLLSSFWFILIPMNLYYLTVEFLWQRRYAQTLQEIEAS